MLRWSQEANLVHRLLRHRRERAASTWNLPDSPGPLELTRFLEQIQICSLTGHVPLAVSRTRHCMTSRPPPKEQTVEKVLIPGSWGTLRSRGGPYWMVACKLMGSSSERSALRLDPPDHCVPIQAPLQIATMRAHASEASLEHAPSLRPGSLSR